MDGWIAGRTSPPVIRGVDLGARRAACAERRRNGRLVGSGSAPERSGSREAAVDFAASVRAGAPAPAGRQNQIKVN
jgi:hypothetical protein